MSFKPKDVEKLRLAMIKKFGKTSYQLLANELGVSRNAIYRAKNNEEGFDKLRARIKEWCKSC